MTKITAAQTLALKWLDAYGPGRLDRYGRIVQDAAYSPGGQRHRSSSQPATFLRLILNGMARARLNTVEITTDGRAALKSEQHRISRQKLVKSANMSDATPNAPADGAENANS